MRVAYKLGETQPLFPSERVPFTLSCQLRPREMLADSGDRSRGVMKHKEEVLEKNGNYPTEQGDAPGKTKSSPLRRVTGDRDGKPGPEGPAFMGNKTSTWYLHTQRIKHSYH